MTAVDGALVAEARRLVDHARQASSDAHAAKLARNQMIARLRGAGMTFGDIAQALNVTRSFVQTMLR